MEINQLELELWQSLEAATKFPQTAEFSNLCTALELELAERPVSEQLQVASNVIVQLSEIYAARVEILLSEWERRYNPTEPIVDIDGCIELFVQSQHLDVAELFEPPDTVNYPTKRSSRNSEKNSSVVGQVDKSILLQHLDDLVGEAPIQTEEEQMQQIRELAHDEDISAWKSAIALWLQQHSGSSSVSLVELQQGLEMPIVEVWLGLLLGGQYNMEQCGEFYAPQSILITKPLPNVLNQRCCSTFDSFRLGT